jgi:hypothetical protein
VGPKRRCPSAEADWVMGPGCRRDPRVRRSDMWASHQRCDAVSAVCVSRLARGDHTLAANKECGARAR